MFPSTLILSLCYTVSQDEVTRWEGVGGVDIKMFNNRNKNWTVASTVVTAFIWDVPQRKIFPFYDCSLHTYFDDTSLCIFSFYGYRHLL